MLSCAALHDVMQALHESLLEVVQVFEDCARYGLLRSLINAGERHRVGRRGEGQRRGVVYDIDTLALWICRPRPEQPQIH